MFIYGLKKDLAEKVSMAHPKTLLSVIGIAEDLEMAIRFAQRPPIKGAATSSFGMGTKASGGIVANTMTWWTLRSWTLGARWWTSRPMPRRTCYRP